MSAPQDQPVTVYVQDSVARIVLNRPERHNAFDDRMIAVLDDRLDEVARRSDVRVVVLAANGKSFSAGADINWMKRMAGYSQAENEADAQALGGMLAKLYRMPKPTVALIQGGVYGGGLGLVAACDIAITAEDADFALSEVRLGLIPAVISPYVIAAIGPRVARRYFLTAERFGAAEAHRIGLVHEVVPSSDLSAASDRLLKQLLAGGPEAIGRAKQLISDVAGRTLDDTLIADTARRIAEARASTEGVEGLSAFLERRKPSWMME